MSKIAREIGRALGNVAIFAVLVIVMWRGERRARRRHARGLL